MARRSTGNRDGHYRQRALLRLGEYSDPLRDALEPRTIRRRQAGQRARECAPLLKQRPTGGHVAKTLRVFAQRYFASKAHRLDDWRGDSEGLGRYAGNPTRDEISNRATRQHAGVFLAIGRRLTARWRRASSARTSSNVPPPRAKATRAM